MVVKGVVVETIVFPLMQVLRDITTGSDPGLGGVLSGSSVSGMGRIASAFSSWPSWDMYSVTDCSSDVGGLMVVVRGAEIDLLSASS